MAQNAFADQRGRLLDERQRRKPPDGRSFKMISGMRKALRRRAALWSPFKKALKLQGLELPDEDHGLRVVDARQNVQAELHRHWSPIFPHKEIPIDIASKCLDRYNVLMGFSNVSIPDDRQLARAAGAARVSAAGPDGIPCAAWA
eukprot:347141-Pyramimonas_sp.AAC.1